jgi:hypothetical protein
LSCRECCGYGTVHQVVVLMRWLTKRAKDCRRPLSCDHTNVIVSPRESDGFTSIDFFARISSSITATIRSGVYRLIRPPNQRTPPTRRVHRVCDQQHLSEALSPATIYLSKIKSSLAIKGCSLITAPDLHLTESTRTSSFQSASISKAPPAFSL